MVYSWIIIFVLIIKKKHSVGGSDFNQRWWTDKAQQFIEEAVFVAWERPF